MSYDNTNSGVLFKNDRKEKPSHPDYKGSVNVDGVEFWLSAWIKDGAKGKFMSLAVQPKEAPAALLRGGAAGARQPNKQDDIDDDIPF